jgi:epoxyqueuosine reductase
LKSQKLKESILALGFDRLGIASVGPHADHGRLEQWLQAGHAASMDWMDRSCEFRRDPALLLEGCRSVLLLSLNYHSSAEEAPPQRGQGRISRYARFRDYHKVMRSMLRRATTLLREDHGASLTKIAVDSAPLLERSLAASAGLGWIGKNTMLIDEKLGSWTFLGAVLSDLDLEPDAPVPDRCGNCRACLDACPTDAFPEAGVLDSRSCISYLTIEHRGDIDAELAGKMGDRIFGCDLCQEVCPWNREVPQTAVEDFQPRSGLQAPLLESLLAMNQESFLKSFAGTPLMRAGLERMQRNARIALSNEEKI